MEDGFFGQFTSELKDVLRIRNYKIEAQTIRRKLNNHQVPAGKKEKIKYRLEKISIA